MKVLKEAILQAIISLKEKVKQGERLKVLKLHSWKVSLPEARRIQLDLVKKVDLEFSLKLGRLEKIAGADVSYAEKGSQGEQIYAAVCVFSFPSLKFIEKRFIQLKASFPYRPGYLAFREGPALLKAFEKVKNLPDLILFDGQGIAHPRGMGVATHLGILLSKPTIGVAKTVLSGKYREPKNKMGAYSYLKTEEKTVGAVLRTRKNVKPVFVSVGNKIDLETAIQVVLKCSKGYRLPEPLRQAHLLANRLRLRSS